MNKKDHFKLHYSWSLQWEV